VAIALGLGRTSRVRTQPDLFAERGEKSGIEREAAHMSCLQGKVHMFYSTIGCISPCMRVA